MFRSIKEKNIKQAKQAFVAELMQQRELAEADHPPNLEKLINLAQSLLTIHETVSDDRTCFMCKKIFSADTPHCEILVSWCVDPTGKVLVAGVHEQHFLTACKKCYGKIHLDGHWKEFKPGQPKESNLNEEVKANERTND